MSPLEERLAGLIHCGRLRAKLSRECCAVRHVARVPSGAGAGAPKFYPCAFCAAGRVVAERLMGEGWMPPPDTIPAATLQGHQRVAFVRWYLSLPSWREAEDHRMRPAEEATLDQPSEPVRVGSLRLA